MNQKGYIRVHTTVACGLTMNEFCIFFSHGVDKDIPYKDIGFQDCTDRTSFVKKLSIYIDTSIEKLTVLNAYVGDGNITTNCHLQFHLSLTFFSHTNYLSTIGTTRGILTQ